MVTKEMFLKYEELRNSGMYNMIIDDSTVMNIMNISKNDYYDIIHNYSEYEKQFYKGDIVNEICNNPNIVESIIDSYLIVKHDISETERYIDRHDFIMMIIDKFKELGK